ncbi:small ubiquitin-related modifier 3 isoform X1 [Kogia breviceps]|uniref:small ubiquitin-related modifier 3 isoform X1 n=1 Tax=Kogia breviceps TaxID=27615 RepID=UPI0034D23EDC
MSEEKPKEGVKTENDHINLKVAGQDGSVVQFKIKRHTPLSKLMKAYCERQVWGGVPGRVRVRLFQEGAEMGVLILSVVMNWLCPRPRPAVPSGGRRAASQRQAGCSSHASGSPDLFLRIV